jgi:hypothetical protein
MALTITEELKNLAFRLVRNSGKNKQNAAEIVALTEGLKDRAEEQRLEAVLSIALFTDGTISLDGAGCIDDELARKMICCAAVMIEERKKEIYA